MKTRDIKTHEPSQPIIEQSTHELPAALTIFLTLAQRTQVLRQLRKVHPDRAAALLIALGQQRQGVCS